MRPSTTTIIDYARLAPSVHNVQPWRFKITDSTITVYIEPSRVLKSGDPTTRELWVSMGICIEAVMQSAKALGFTPTLNFTQTNSQNEAVARISIAKDNISNPDTILLDAIKNRQSYRETMKHIDVPEAFAKKCQASIKDLPSINIHMTNDKKILHKVATISDKGMQVALSTKEFRKELLTLLHTNVSKARTGLHGYVMGQNLLQSIWQKVSILFNIDTARQGHADKKRVLEASRLLFITAKGDVPPFWFDSGRAYMRVALEITKAGYTHSTLTAVVEAGRFHEDVEDMLGTHERIQSLMRIGQPTKSQPASPRLDTKDLIT